MTPMKTDKKIAKVEEKITFEKAMARLDKIVAEMESGSLSLEEMISHFEEGQSLIKFCGKKLNEVERKVEMLVKKGDEVATEPFEETEGEADEDAEYDGKKSGEGVTEKELF